MADELTNRARRAAEEILKPDYSLQRDGHLFSYLHNSKDVCSGSPYKCIKRMDGKKKQYCPMSYMKYDEVWGMDIQCCECSDMAFEMAVQRIAAIIERYMREPGTSVIHRRIEEITSATLDLSELPEEDIQELQRLVAVHSSDVMFSGEFTTTELNQSVISWTRYDGTPETLPKDESRVLVVFLANGNICTNIAYFKNHNHESFSWIMESWIKTGELGDAWAYLPEPQAVEGGN